MDSPGLLRAWLLLAMLLLSLGLGDHALLEPDEGRNAVVAQEMAASGDLLTPRLDGLPYLDKPFLYFSLGALSIRLLGSSELAVRLPSLLATWATVLLTAWFAARLFGRPTAAVAGLACATSLLAVAFSRIVIFDSLLSLFVTAALVAFHLAVEDEGSAERRRSRWTTVAWVAMAFGVFTKGPVALLPLVVATPYSIWRRRAGAVFGVAGWLPFLALVAPWLALSERAVPGFLHYALVVETWQRVTTDEMRRNAPVWFYLPVLVAGTFPWITMVAWSLRRWMREASRATAVGRSLVYLALWILVPLALFSLSHSKRHGYVLPLVPAFALLAAWSWGAASRRWPGVRAAAVGWLFGAALFGALWSGLGVASVPAELAATADTVAARLSVACLVAALASWAMAADRTWAPVALSLPLVLFPLATAPLLRGVAESRSGRVLAEAVGGRLTPESEIVGHETFSPSLAFYLDRRIAVSSRDGGPFASNYLVYAYDSLIEGGEAASLRPAGAWREAIASCDRPVYLLLKSSFAAERHELEAAGLPLVAANRKYTLMGPCRPASSGAGDGASPNHEE